MKLIYLLIVSTLILYSNASEETVNEKSLSSLGNWINHNIIKPISNATSWTVNNLVNAVTSPEATAMYNDYMNWLNLNVVNPLSGAASWTLEQLTGGYYWTVNSIIGTHEIPVEINPCSYTCFNRVHMNYTTTDYSYDKSHGCVSKGLNRNDINIFDDCCDEHNKCLNNQCCTDKCTVMKFECDFQFSYCMNKKCIASSSGDDFLNCNNLIDVLNNFTNNQRCRQNIIANRKICLC